MKKHILLIVFIGILLPIYAQVATPPSIGDGTFVNPYQIANLENLYWVSQDSTTWDKYYIQIDNINCWDGYPWIIDWDDGKGFTPIGNNDIKFTGSYDGLEHTISGLYINRETSDYIGLFGYTESATIENLGLEYVDIIGRDYVGGVTGMSYLSNISNCYTKGEVDGVNNTGALVGSNYESSISTSYSICEITRYDSTNTFFGGFCGYNKDATIEYCYSASIIFESTGIIWTSLDKGFVGGDEGINIYNNNFFDYEVSEQLADTVGSATAKSTVEMQTLSTFTDGGWDFASVWNMSSPLIEDGYPHFKWEDVFLPVSVTPALIDSNYQITSITDLRWIAEDNSRWNYHYQQITDINFEDAVPNISYWGNGSGFKPIGNDIVKFTGTYDGQGSIINGLFINRIKNDNIGFFGYTDSATIQNLGLIRIDLSGKKYVGGLTGMNNNSSIRNCYVSGNVAGETAIGGIAGSNSNSTISQCYSAVSSSGINEVGSFIGYNSLSTVSDCYSMGNSIRTSGVNIYFGGFCGYNQDSAIEYSYSTGKVYESIETIWTSKDKGFLGGEEGINSYIGNFFNLESSYQDTDALGAATAKTTDEMKVQSTFTDVGWDFESIWDLSSPVANDGYVHLRWENVILPVEIAPNQIEGVYQISSITDLRWIAEDNTRWSYRYIQINDIDLEQEITWRNGGFKLTYVLKGSYNGNGHKILNIYIAGGSIFGRIEETATIENMDISGEMLAGTGTYANTNHGTISNCTSSVNISYAGYDSGGLVGRNYGIIRNSSSSGSIHAGGMVVGGLVGRNYGTIDLSFFIGNFVEGWSTVGGLVGTNEGIIINSFSTGNVKHGLQCAGGLVGKNRSYADIINCYSTGEVSDNYSGGLIEDNQGVVNTSFWDIETSGTSASDGGIGLPTSQMQTLSTFTDVGWDFVGESTNGTEDIWDIDGTTNNGYPFLSWMSTGIIDNGEFSVDNYKLEQNYPNPFNPTTTISFSIPSMQDVKLSVYNSNGQLVSKLVNEVVNAGMHSVNFDAENLNSGIYFYTLQTDGKKLSNKMLLIK